MLFALLNGTAASAILSSLTAAVDAPAFLFNAAGLADGAPVVADPTGTFTTFTNTGVTVAGEAYVFTSGSNTELTMSQAQGRPELGSDDFTIEVDLNPSVLSQAGVLGTYDTGTGDRSFLLRVDAQLEFFGSQTGSSATLMLSNSIPLNTLTRIKITREDTALKMYFDDVEVDSYTLSSGYTFYEASSAGLFRIGNYASNRHITATMERISMTLPRSPAHRYWRVYNGTHFNNVNEIEYREVEFLNSAGTDISTGGTPLGTFPSLANLFDRDGATTSTVSFPEREWVGYDFGSPVSVEQIALTVDNSVQSHWESFTVQWSDDGSTWNFYDLIQDVASPSVGERLVFPVTDYLGAEPDLDPAAAHQYFRIVTLEDGGGNSYQNIAEMQLLDSGDVELSTVSSNATADSSFSASFDGPKAFDDDGATYWSDNQEKQPRTLQYDFGTAQLVSSFTIQARTSNPDRTPISYLAQVSDDGTSWKTVKEIIGEAEFTAGETRTYVI